MKNFRLISIFAIVAILSSSAFAGYIAPPFPTGKGGTGTSTQSANKAVTTDSNSHLVSSGSTTDTELGYVHGVTSAIQTQLGTKASAALDNIATTALSADLICASSGSCKLGSAAKPFGDSYLNLMKDASGNVIFDLLNRVGKNSSNNASFDFSGTVFKLNFNLDLFGSTSGDIQISSGATPTAHTVTLPPTVCAAGQYWADNGSGVMSCTSVSSGNLSVVDGGNTAYAIQAGDNVVRDTTTLTTDRAYTLPLCTAGNIGEKHIVKNLASQAHNITLTAGGSDNIDGSSTQTLFPGDSATVVCGAYSAAGSWDLN